MNKCIFLDRDGVLNVERGDYTYLPDDFMVVPGVPKAIKKIKEAGFLAIVITNQAGISKGLYSREQMHICHNILHEATQGMIDKIYYCPYHPVYSNSIARKPDTLMFEKAIARFHIDPAQSWMIGDREGDLIAAKKMGIQRIMIAPDASEIAQFNAPDLITAVERILS